MRIVTFSAKLEFGVRAVLVGSLDVQFVRTGSCSIRFCQQRGDAGMNEPAQRFCERLPGFLIDLVRVVGAQC